jgi:phage gp16-like protein
MNVSFAPSDKFSTAPARSILIKRLHVMQRELGLDEDLYRDKLEALTGKRSAAQLTENELERAVQGFRRIGTATPPKIPATPQGRMLQALWISLWNLGLTTDNSDTALLAFVKRQAKVEAVQWLKDQRAVEQVAEAMKGWMVREAQVDFGSRRGAEPWQRLPAYRVCEAQWAILARAQKLPCETLMLFTQKCPLKVEGFPQATSNYHWGVVSKHLGRLVRAVKEVK